MSSIKNSTSVAGIDAAMPLKTKMISRRLNNLFFSGCNIVRNAPGAARARACVTGAGE